MKQPKILSMSPLQELKAPALRAYVGLITFSATSLAIGLGITLKKRLVFEYHSNTGVVGWLSANAYPKQQEYFFYLLALLGVPIVIGLYALGWHLYSHGCAKLTAQPVQRVLKANALASIPLWLCWLQVYHIGQWTLMGLILPMGLSLLIKLVLLSKRYFPNLKIASTARSYSDNGLTKIASTVRSYSDNGLTKIASTARSYSDNGSRTQFAPTVIMGSQRSRTQFAPTVIIDSQRSRAQFAPTVIIDSQRSRAQLAPTVIMTHKDREHSSLLQDLGARIYVPYPSRFYLPSDLCKRHSR